MTTVVLNIIKEFIGGIMKGKVVLKWVLIIIIAGFMGNWLWGCVSGGNPKLYDMRLSKMKKAGHMQKVNIRLDESEDNRIKALFYDAATFAFLLKRDGTESDIEAEVRIDGKKIKADEVFVSGYEGYTEYAFLANMPEDVSITGDKLNLEIRIGGKTYSKDIKLKKKMLKEYSRRYSFNKTLSSNVGDILFYECIAYPDEWYIRYKAPEGKDKDLIGFRVYTELDKAIKYEYLSDSQGRDISNLMNVLVKDNMKMKQCISVTHLLIKDPKEYHVDLDLEKEEMKTDIPLKNYLANIDRNEKKEIKRIEIVLDKDFLSKYTPRYEIEEIALDGKSLNEDDYKTSVVFSQTGMNPDEIKILLEFHMPVIAEKMNFTIKDVYKEKEVDFKLKFEDFLKK